MRHHMIKSQKRVCGALSKTFWTRQGHGTRVHQHGGLRLGQDLAAEGPVLWGSESAPHGIWGWLHNHVHLSKFTEPASKGGLLLCVN